MKIKERITITPHLLICVSLIGLLVLQIISYARAEWVGETGVWTDVVLLSKNAYSNKIMEAFRFGFLALVLIGSLLLLTYDAKSWIGIVVLSGFAIVYSAGAIFDIGLSRAMYSGNLPLIYLLVIGFFVGQKQSVWENVKRLFLPLVIVYAILFTYEFIDSYSKYGWVIYQNSSMMAYYSHLFWTSLAYIYCCITEKKKKILIYPILIVLFIGAIVLRSRGWVVQAALLILITSFTLYREKKPGLKSTLKGVAVITVISIVAAGLLDFYFSEFVMSLEEKGLADSRSLQYIEILGQTEPYKWILGQGISATYIHKGESTRFIDNQTLYIAFHYGALFTMCYFLPYFFAMGKCVQKATKMRFWLFSALVVFLWIASVNGLSVYNGIQLDVKSFIMPFLAGHIYQMAKDSK